MDSGYSRHMTDDKDQFIILKKKHGGLVTFSDNDKKKIIGIDKIKITPSTFIENILLVDSPKYNLPSTSQILW